MTILLSSKLHRYLKRGINILILLVLSLQAGTTQNTEPHNLDQVDSYSNEKTGTFYIIIPVDDYELAKGRAEIKKLLAQQDTAKLRVSNFRIVDVKKGDLPYLIIRRFTDYDQVNLLIKSINQNTQYCKNKAIAISQKNYRKFMKKKDIEELQLFLEHG